MKSWSMIAVALIAFVLFACGPLNLASAPTPEPTATARAPTQVAPTATRAPTPVGSVPAWWVSDVAMPTNIEFTGIVRGNATWSTTDLNADKLRDDFVRRAHTAGYATTVITKSQGAIYDILIVKESNAFALNILVGSDKTILTGSRVGVFHLKATGAANLEVDLPMRTRVDIAPGSEISIGTSIPNSQCRECEYFINIHIAPFKGAGTYDGKPGISIIDLQVIPGVRFDQEDYRWAQSCVVVVRDALGGTFDCRGLQNVYDQTKLIDVSGSWQQPAQ
ncbi:MAG: hypothetical protein HY868_05840 [Chloroflexi bacterium]|nr:hypothetical protein [Chloroflexota bacterium]